MSMTVPSGGSSKGGGGPGPLPWPQNRLNKDGGWVFRVKGVFTPPPLSYRKILDPPLTVPSSIMIRRYHLLFIRE